ncbi:MAG: MBL fold metallo-hydrolase [Gammaproteobacteria bacterium]|nr:MBL fold metallo-hydrolase [Gammaproteobacteria bacterium]
MNDAFTARWRSAPGARIRPAATVVVLRDAGSLQTLLLQRAARSDDMLAGASLFPGGALHPSDRAAHAHCIGLDDAAASARLGVKSGGLDFYIAALRECFEEAGLLFAAARDGAALSAAQLAALATLRPALVRGAIDLAGVCTQLDLRLTPGALRYIAHWLTPPGAHKRFDTRFFVAGAPAGQIPSPDRAETIECLWRTPAEALDPHTALLLAQPTRRTLQWLGTHGSLTAVLETAARIGAVARIMPRIAVGADGRRAVLPDEPAWAEIGRLDPAGRGDQRYDLQPGVCVELSARLRRITAPNGNLMTGPGTNSYFIGGGSANEWALLDPGPADDAHVRALLAALPGRLRWILVTHTHKDHSPAAAVLRAATGAQLLGMASHHTEWQDSSFAPDVALQDGAVLQLPGGTTLRVIHTPGHASNHLCYELPEERLLFSGDHLMQHATVVINPPDGDMAAYLGSLRALARLELDWIAPGHGFLMPGPRTVIDRVIEHRLRREAQVLTALRPQPQSLEELLAICYADVHVRLHAVAARSLLAHLIKLRAEGRAIDSQGGWRRATP